MEPNEDSADGLFWISSCSLAMKHEKDAELKKNSFRVRKESMKVNKEFSKIEEDIES